MNRSQAIESAKNVRRGMTVHLMTDERKRYVAPVAAVDEVKDESGNVSQAAVDAVEEQIASPRIYSGKTYKTISEAKKAMRAIGCGVALIAGETLPQ